MTDYDLMYNTIKLFLKKNNNNVGTATGFFFVKDNEKYIVTNRHVVNDMDEVTFVFHQSYDAPGRVRNFTIGGNDFRRIIKIHSQYDLAIINITNFITDTDVFKELNQQDIITDFELSYDNVMQNVFIVGYPIGIEDELNKLPTFSTGITSSNILIDYNGRPEILLNAFALPGSSGSPVFTIINNRKRLIGIISSGKVYSDGKPIGNLCLAVKAQVISELI